MNPTGAANDFQALERLRKLSFAETVPAPKIPEQIALELTPTVEGDEVDPENGAHRTKAMAGFMGARGEVTASTSTVKKGLVTVPGHPGDDVHPDTLKSVLS